LGDLTLSGILGILVKYRIYKKNLITSNLSGKSQNLNISKATFLCFPNILVLEKYYHRFGKTIKKYNIFEVPKSILF